MPERDLRALVVDDEQLARDELCYLLDLVGGVEVIGQAGNGPEAIDAVDRIAPDLVFLDVQMPGLDGFEVARTLVGGPSPPEFVFVTAFDQHAIEAFEVNAVDYLLKPVEAGRLEMAVERVRRRRLRAEPLNDQLQRIVQLVEHRQESARSGRRQGGRALPAGAGRRRDFRVYGGGLD